jgi:hypothetical protein
MTLSPGTSSFEAARLAQFKKSLSRETVDAQYALDYNDPAYKDRCLEIARKAWVSFAGENSKLPKGRSIKGENNDNWLFGLQKNGSRLRVAT